MSDLKMTMAWLLFNGWSVNQNDPDYPVFHEYLNGGRPCSVSEAILATTELYR